MCPFRLFTLRIFCEVAHWLGASSLTWAQYIHNLVTGFTCFYMKLTISLKTSDFQKLFFSFLYRTSILPQMGHFMWSRWHHCRMQRIRQVWHCSCCKGRHNQDSTQSKWKRWGWHWGVIKTYPILLMLLLVLFSKVSITLSDSYTEQTLNSSVPNLLGQYYELNIYLQCYFIYRYIFKHLHFAFAKTFRTP